MDNSSILPGGGFIKIYRESPIRELGNISIFLDADDYLTCYEEVAGEHIKSHISDGGNPFQSAQQIDASTKVTIEKVRASTNNNSRILEIGIGVGLLPKELPDLCWSGVDISLKYLTEVQHLYSNLAQANVESLPYSSDQFDVVVCGDVLEHVLMLDIALTEIKRVLKPGGKIIIRVPNKEDLSFYLTTDAPDFSHVRTFSYESLRLLMEKCHGFNLGEMDYCKPVFGIVQQLRYKPLPRALNLSKTLNQLSLSLTDDLSSEKAALTVLENFSSVDLESYVDALIFLRDWHSELFDQMAEILVEPAELIGIFEKPVPSGGN